MVSPFPKKGLWCPCPVCGQALVAEFEEVDVAAEFKEVDSY